MSNDDEKKIVQLRPRKIETAPAQLDGIYELLSATLARLRERGIFTLQATLDGYMVTVKPLDPL